MHRLILIGMFVMWGMTAMSQPLYERSAGVRLGRTSGLTFKKFTVPNESLEIIMSGRKEGIQVTSLYEFYEPMDLSFNENFYAFYGVGGHVGYENYDNLNKVIDSQDLTSYVYENKSYFVIGADAIIGIEYRWLSVPCTIGFDIKPYFNFIGLRYTHYQFWDSAVTFKYVF